MFVSKHTLTRFFGGIAIAAAVVAVAVPSALARTIITDTLGGNGSPKATPDVFERAVAIHASQVASPAPGINLITDTLGGNGSPKATPYGGLTASDEAYVHGGTPPTVFQSTSGTGFNWGDAGIGAGVAVGLALMLLVGGPRLRTHKGRVLAA